MAARFFVKYDESGKETLRVEIESDASPVDVDRALREIRRWHRAQLERQERWLEGVADRETLRQQIVKMYKRGWGPTKVADYLNQEILALVRAHARSWGRPQPGQYDADVAIPLMVAMFESMRHMQEAELLLSLAMPRFNDAERRDTLLWLLDEIRQSGEPARLEMRSRLISKRTVEYIIHG